ncbi:DMT family transporter [Rhizobium sp. L1K21]|uniref:DMT family transporter n=1 Tax=Rhizobium sp. L1K21 TaxID=2954933 RepID=UPI002092EA15|nr:DMT family transporter [Rhizobium sp. L1K21]MCO6185153.1 DMT family transporter [Rhizobium sp. L1K21]
MSERAQSAAKAYILLTTTALIWGGNSVAGKLAVGHISPLLLTNFRWIIAFIIILTVSTAQIKRDWPVLRRKWYIPVLLGIVGYSVFNGFLYSGLHYTSAINAVILQAGVPAIIFIINFVFFRVRVFSAQIAGFMITLCGVLLTAARGDPATLFGLSLNKGDLLILGAVLVYAFYTVGLRWKPDVHWKSMITFAFAGAVLASLPMGIVEYQSGNMLFPDFTGWMIVAYAGLFPSLVSQTFYVRGVEMIGPNRAGLFINLVPIFGTILSIILVGETFHLYHLIALTLALGGIWLAERTARR